MADERKPLNRLRTLLREKKPAFGAIATMPSLQAVQVIANSGLDWVIVDLEHGAIDLAAAHAMIVATAGTPCVPLDAHRRQPAASRQGADGSRRARHQFSDDLLGRRSRARRAQRALSAARRADVGTVLRAAAHGA